MAICTITSITNPTSSSSYQVSATVLVTWTYSGLCNDWNVTQIKLQTNYSGSWADVSTLFSGTDPITSGSRSITLPSSVTNEGDYFRLKLTSEEEELGE